jgi:hypothetical protein
MFLDIRNNNSNWDCCCTGAAGQNKADLTQQNSAWFGANIGIPNFDQSFFFSFFSDDL